MVEQGRRSLETRSAQGRPSCCIQLRLRVAASLCGLPEDTAQAADEAASECQTQLLGRSACASVVCHIITHSMQVSFIVYQIIVNNNLCSSTLQPLSNSPPEPTTTLHLRTCILCMADESWRRAMEETDGRRHRPRGSLQLGQH